MSRRKDGMHLKKLIIAWARRTRLGLNHPATLDYTFGCLDDHKIVIW